MTRSRLLLGSLALAAVFLSSAWLYARQQPAAAASPERAQDQKPAAGSPFSVLPGFKVVRVTPDNKTDSLIVITFDSLGRPTVSQSASGSGSSPRILIDNDGDGIYESEKIFSDKINTCHGLFWSGRTLYADCFGPRDPATDGPAPDPSAQPQGGGGNAGPNALGVPGLYKLTDANGDDAADTIERITRYISNGMGDHGPHAIRRAPDGTVSIVLGNNTMIPDDRVDHDTTPNWANLKERQFLPSFNDPRFGNSTRIGIHGTVSRLEEDKKQFAILFTGMRNTYDFAYTTNGEAFAFDSDMEWDVNAPWYREVNTVHIIPGGDGGYRNGTGKLQDEYFDVLPALRHLRRGSPVGVETYESYAYPAKFFDSLFEADWSRGRLLYTALTKDGAGYKGREDLAEFIHGEPMPISDLEIGPDGNMYFTTGGGAGTGGLYKVIWTGAAPVKLDMTGLLAVVRQPQPLSSWAWANIEKVKTSMGAAFGTGLESLAKNAAARGQDRARAILELQRHGPPPSPALLKSLLSDREEAVRAAAVYAAGVQTGDAAKAVAAAALKDLDPLVQRRAAEALVRQGLKSTQPSFAPVADIHRLLSSPDRHVRYSARLALEHTPRTEWANLVMADTTVTGLTEGLLALTNTKTSEADLRPVFDKVLGLMRRATLTPDEKIRVLRIFEVAATEVPAGVDPEIKKQAHDELIAQFKALAPTAAVADCQNRSVTTGCSTTLLAHHMAKVLAYTGEADVIDPVLALIEKAGGANGQNDQPGQIDYAYALRVIDNGWTPEQKQRVTAFYAKASKWRGGSTFAGHVNNLFDATIVKWTDTERQAAYRAVPLFAPLSPEEMAAAEAAAAARGRGGFGGPPPGAPGAAGTPGPGPAGTGAVAAVPTAQAAAGGGGRRGGGGGGRGATVPGLARNVPLGTQERYDNLVFPRGGGPGNLTGRGGAPNAQAGAQVFEQSCASCHKFGSSGATYGPELTNIAGTMLRRDVLRAIFFPDEQVATKYRTAVINTRDNQEIRGLLVNETATTIVLKTAEQADPVTVQKAQIVKRTTEDTSIMPPNLPDQVGDQNISHVVAYLMAGPPR